MYIYVFHVIFEINIAQLPLSALKVWSLKWKRPMVPGSWKVKFYLEFK